MSLASQATQQKFPFGYEDVFNGLIEVIPKTGMSLKTSDKVIGRITASAGMSLFSYGENLTIVVEKIEQDLTLVAIESALKMGANLTGAHRHQENFEKIISNLSQHLQHNDVGFDVKTRTDGGAIGVILKLIVAFIISGVVIYIAQR